MSINKLENQIKEKKSFLCIGLDIDLEKIPNHLKEKEDPIFSFAKDIIDSTNKYAVAYKPNIAFFEAYGISGWKSLEKIINYLNSNYPEIFTIADAKRGDIGNTSNMYAKAFLKNLEFDSIKSCGTHPLSLITSIFKGSSLSILSSYWFNKIVCFWVQ